MKKITPFLWFDDKAEEAANFYVSVFKNSKLGKITRYNKESAAAVGVPEGTVMTVSFNLDGEDFVALNGNQYSKFTDAVSLVVNCETQDEVDYFWNKLTQNGGQEVACGWLKDKYGLSWQVTPTILPRLLQSDDPEKAKRAMHAMMQMKKIIIEDLENA